MHHHAPRSVFKPLSAAELRYIRGGDAAAGAQVGAAFHQINVTLKPVETAAIQASGCCAGVINAVNAINCVSAQFENAVTAAVTAA